MPPTRIALGYNAVDNEYFAAEALRWRNDPTARTNMPTSDYFLTVCRFVPEKNLIRLIEAFTQYRRSVNHHGAWDLVLCGDGPGRDQVLSAALASEFAASIHFPGFVQVDELPRWYSQAGAFVLPSLMEPWGLVANEAAATRLPLLVSSRAGCSTTLVPDPEGSTGARFDPTNVTELTAKLKWLAEMPKALRDAMGCRASETVGMWGPSRFAQGVIEAISLARNASPHDQKWGKGQFTQIVRGIKLY